MKTPKRVDATPSPPVAVTAVMPNAERIGAGFLRGFAGILTVRVALTAKRLVEPEPGSTVVGLAHTITALAGLPVMASVALTRLSWRPVSAAPGRSLTFAVCAVR